MGGIGRYGWSLLQELAEIDQTNEYVCYFTQLKPPGPVPLNARISLRIFEAGMIDERFDQVTLPDLLNDDLIDVYHNPTFAVPVIRSAARTVATVHDVVFRRYPNLVEPRLRKFLDDATRRACRHADRIITVSQFSKQEIAGLYEVSTDRISVIHNGIRLPESPRSRPSLPSELREQGIIEDNYLLYVGSIEPKKNIEVLLKAFAQVLNRVGKTCRLVLAGSMNSSEYPFEERIQALGIAGRVSYLGYVSEAHLEELYRCASVFVYPSLYEGFGFPPLEAMARGIPTVVSKASSLPEVVGDAGLLFDPTSPQELANILAALVSDDRAKQELGAKGRERALSFTVREMALQHLALYRKVAERG